MKAFLLFADLRVYGLAFFLEYDDAFLSAILFIFLLLFFQFLFLLIFFILFVSKILNLSFDFNLRCYRLSRQAPLENSPNQAFVPMSVADFSFYFLSIMRFSNNFLSDIFLRFFSILYTNI